jgi:predicted SprT family Zn-dependent metalloprotease
MSGVVTFVTGAMSVVIAYALFSIKTNEYEEIEETEDVSNVSTKRYELSCQTCRKLKFHIEVSNRVFECCKCHRRIFLTAS